MCKELISLSLGLLVVTVLGAPAPPNLDTDPHLMGWWKLDEASGTTVADSSKHGRNGVLKGGLSLEKASVDGCRGKAIALDGKAGFIEITGYKGVTGAGPRTVAVWIKTKRPRGQIMTWGHNDFGKMFTFGFIRGRAGITPNGGYYYMNPEIHDGTWHHIAVVVLEADPPNLHDHVRLYKDGELAEVHDIGLLDLWPLMTGSDENVRIGTHLAGAIDDLRLYDRALSEKEIEALFRRKK